MLDRLVEEVGEDESYPVVSLMEIVGVLVEKYEESMSRSCLLNSCVLLISASQLY